MYKKLQSSLGWGFKEIRWEQKVINVEYKKNFFSSIQEKKQKRLKKSCERKKSSVLSSGLRGSTREIEKMQIAWKGNR